MAMLFLTGMFDNVSVVIRSTLLQALTPDHLQGRVSAVNSVFIGMSNELGGFESGAAAWLLGTVASVVFGGAGSLAVVLGVAWRWPEVATPGHDSPRLARRRDGRRPDGRSSDTGVHASEFFREGLFVERRGSGVILYLLDEPDQFAQIGSSNSSPYFFIFL